MTSLKASDKIACEVTAWSSAGKEPFKVDPKCYRINTNSVHTQYDWLILSPDFVDHGLKMCICDLNC